MHFIIKESLFEWPDRRDSIICASHVVSQFGLSSVHLLFFSISGWSINAAGVTSRVAIFECWVHAEEEGTGTNAKE